MDPIIPNPSTYEDGTDNVTTAPETGGMFGGLADYVNQQTAVPDPPLPAINLDALNPKPLVDYQPIYDRVAPHLLYVGNQIANSVKTGQTLDGDMGKFLEGKTAQEIDQGDQLKAQLDAVQKQATDLASKTTHLDDSQFQEYLKAIAQNANHQIQSPTMPALQNPNHGQLLAAALAAWLDPHHAAQNAALPWQMRQQEQAQGYQQDMQRFQTETAAQQKRQELLTQLATVQEHRDIAAAQIDQRDRESKLDSLDKQATAIRKQISALGSKDLTDTDKANLKGLDDEITISERAMYEGKTAEARTSARTRLAQLLRAKHELLGSNSELPLLPPAPQGQYPDELYKTAQTGLLGAKTMTENQIRQPRIERMRAQIRLSDANVSKAHAAVADMASKIQSREYQTDISYRRLAQNGWAKSQTTIAAGLRSLSAQADTIRTNMRSVEKSFQDGTVSPTTVDGSGNSIPNPAYTDLQNRYQSYKDSLDAVQQEWNQLKNEALQTRDQITGSSEVPDTSTMGPTYRNKRAPGVGYGPSPFTGEIPPWNPGAGIKIEPTSNPSIGGAILGAVRDAHIVPKGAVKGKRTGAILIPKG